MARAARGGSWPASERAGRQADLRRLLRDAEISTRVTLDALVLILACGRFKTRYEPGCVPNKNPARSAAEEAQVWNVSAESPGDLPIFGYAATAGDVSVPETRATLHMAYGSARVLLSDTVRSRCTVFFGDSLWALRHDEGAPAPLSEPDELCWLADRGLPEERHNIDQGGPDEVVEIQILKGLRVSEIASVRFDFEPPHLVQDALEQQKVSWRVNPMLALPKYSARHFVADRLSAGR